MKQGSAFVPGLFLALLAGCATPVDEPVGSYAAAVKPASGSSGPGGGAGKVTICHIPPGNPDNTHTIVVGAAAVDAHLDHGDVLGACPEEPTSGSAGCPCPNGSSSSTGGTATSGAGGCGGSSDGAGGDPINGPQQ
jgi:hypothetical protein